MTWIEILKLATPLLFVPTLAGISKVISKLNDLALRQAVQDEKIRGLQEDMQGHRAEFHEHVKDDGTAFGSVNVRINGLAENISGALGMLGRKAAVGMREQGEQQ